MTTHKKNHYVPASYFSPWCSSDRKLVYYKWFGNRFLVDRANPKSIACKPNLYTLHGAPADKTSQIETKFFTPLIDEPGAAIQKILVLGSTKFLTVEQRHFWARYLMALLVRTPEQVENIQKLGREGVLTALRQNPEEYEAIKPTGAPSTLEECIAPWFLDNFGLARVIPELIDKLDTRNEIVAMNWFCRDFSGCNFELLTCDRPLIRYRGVHDEDFFLALPLSPKVGFFIVKSLKTWDKFCEMPLRDLAIKFNESLIANSVEHVYSSNDKAEKFIQERLKLKARDV
jgi:hypothetical protein